MRTLNAALTTAQSAMNVKPAYKIVLTYGETTYTLEEGRIKDLAHFESPWSMYAKDVVLRNHDGYFDEKDLKGYQAVIHWGADTASGKKYSATSPLKVVWQEFDVGPGQLFCRLNLLGIPNLMDLDEANDDYIPSKSLLLSSGIEATTQETAYTKVKEIELTEDMPYAEVSFDLKASTGTATARIYKNDVAIGTVRTNATSTYENFKEEFSDWSSGDKIQIYAKISNASYTAYVRSMKIYSIDESMALTVKELLTAIAGATLDCYDHCTAYTIVWDNDEEDDTLLNFTPADSFRIYQRGSRLAAFRRVLEYCNCAARFEDDGKIHILIPTTSGVSYDYEYKVSDGHPFLAKAYRQTLVIPNYIVVESQEDDDPQYSGYASSATSYGLLPKRAYFRTRLDSNATATAIAEALIAREELDAEMGVVERTLINCGQEVFDYVKVGAFSDSDVYRTGNIGWIERHANPEEVIYHQRFGFGAPPLVRHTKELYSALQAETGVAFDRLYAKDAYIENLQIENIDAVWLDEDGNIDASQLTSDFLDNIPQGESYGLTKRMHLDASGLYFESDTIYTLRLSGNAAAKLWKSTDAPDDPDEGDLWIDTNDTPNVVKRWSGSEWQELPADDIEDLERGIYVREVKSAALSPDGLVLTDELEDGTYSRVLTADLSAEHLKLSSVVQDANYRTTSDTEKTNWSAKAKTYVQATAPSTGLVAGDLWFDSDDGYKVYRWTGSAWVTVQDGEITQLRTDIEAGKLTLSAETTIDGYLDNTSGVLLGALFGIRLYGGQISLSTHDTYAHALANTGIQCYVGTDGAIYAGAGAVKLSADGLKIVGEALYFYYGASLRGSLFGWSLGGLKLDAANGDLTLGSANGVSLVADSGEIYLGATGYVNAASTKGFILPNRTSHPSSPSEGTIYFNTSDHNMYGYMNGSWQTMHNY
jgi:hypothetical protein